MFDPVGEYRARVGVDHARFGVTIHLAHRGGLTHGVDTQTALAVPHEIVYQVVGPQEGHVQEPFLRLPDAAARALLDGLAAHYGAAGDVRQLRADYDHERKRFDQLLGRLPLERLVLGGTVISDA